MFRKNRPPAHFRFTHEKNVKNFHRSDSILLLVEYAPHVDLTPSRDPLREGDDAEYACAAHANPPPAQDSLRWFLDGNIVAGEHSDKMALRDVDRSLNGKIVTCEVSNRVGKSEVTHTLEILCEFSQIKW